MGYATDLDDRCAGICGGRVNCASASPSSASAERGQFGTVHQRRGGNSGGRGCDAGDG